MNVSIETLMKLLGPGVNEHVGPGVHLVWEGATGDIFVHDSEHKARLLTRYEIDDNVWKRGTVMAWRLRRFAAGHTDLSGYDGPDETKDAKQALPSAQAVAKYQSQSDLRRAVVDEQRRTFRSLSMAEAAGYQPGDIGRDLATLKAELAAAARQLATSEAERKALHDDVTRLRAENHILATSADELLRDVHSNGAVRKLGVLLAERNAEIDRLDALRTRKPPFPGRDKAGEMGRAIAAIHAGWKPIVSLVGFLALAGAASAQGLMQPVFSTGTTSNLLVTDSSGSWHSIRVCDGNEVTPTESVDCKLLYWREQLSIAQKRKADIERDIDHANERINAFTDAKRAR